MITNINSLALGTAQFGMPYGISNKQGQVQIKVVKDILNYACSLGIDTLDTAIMYGNSEKCLGHIGVKSWKVISKLPTIPESFLDINTSNWVRQSILGSLQRLRIPKLYGLLLHSPQELLSSRGEDIFNSLKALKMEGLIDKIGISIYSPSELDTLLNHFDLDLIQCPCNILDRNLVQSSWLPRLEKLGIEVHIRSIFLQGLLLMDAQERYNKFNRWQSIWKQWYNWLKESNLSPLEACLNYVFSLSGVSRIIIGVDNLSQLNDILEVPIMNLEFPDFQACHETDLIYPYNWNQFTRS